MVKIKRPSADDGADEGEMKRAKVDECVAEYEVVLGGEVYVNVDKLFKCAEYRSCFFNNKDYGRSAENFMNAAKLSVILALKNGVKKGVLNVTTKYVSKSVDRLVKKDEHIISIIATAKENSLPPAPPVLKDDDLVFFKDNKGNEHEVEMRGKRTMEGIFFKAKDVALLFGSDHLVDTIQRPNTVYEESVDYVSFAVSKPEKVQNSHSEGDHHSAKKQKQKYHQSKEVFLTMVGLLHAVHSARSPVAKEFRRWVCTTVFTSLWATQKQTDENVEELCRVNKRFLHAFMKIVENEISCIYLVDTAKREQGKKVYKFGRSKKLKERVYDHTATFGEGTFLDTVIFVPTDYLSKAEALLNNSISEGLRFKDGKARELLLLDPSDYKTVRTIMRMIADKYNGSMTVHATVHQKEMMGQEFKYELRIKDLERVITMSEAQKEIEKQRLESEKHRLESEKQRLEKQMESEKHRLEIEKQQLEKQVESEKHRLEIAQLKAAAEVNAKDREIEALQRTTDAQNTRIRELEELNRQLSKRLSEPEDHP